MHAVTAETGFTASLLPLLVGTRFQALFHSPSRGSFHLSLTVLVHYRLPGVFSLRRWSSQIRTGFLVPRATWGQHGSPVLFAYEAITLYGRPFQVISAKNWIFNSLQRSKDYSKSSIFECAAPLPPAT
jgi:hypothetical protein